MTEGHTGKEEVTMNWKRSHRERRDHSEWEGGHTGKREVTTSGSRSQIESRGQKGCKKKSHRKGRGHDE